MVTFRVGLGLGSGVMVGLGSGVRIGFRVRVRIRVSIGFRATRVAQSVARLSFVVSLIQSERSRIDSRCRLCYLRVTRNGLLV